MSMHKGGQAGDPIHDDYEEFLADIEADPHARSNVNLYKDPSMWRIAGIAIHITMCRYY